MENLKNKAEKKHYLQSVDGFVDISLIDENHGSLRTLFDPYSAEWNGTNMKTKTEILKIILSRGNQSLSKILFQYKITFKNSPASKDVEAGLVELLQYLLTEKDIKK